MPAASDAAHIGTDPPSRPPGSPPGSSAARAPKSIGLELAGIPAPAHASGTVAPSTPAASFSGAPDELHAIPTIAALTFTGLPLEPTPARDADGTPYTLDVQFPQPRPGPARAPANGSAAAQGGEPVRYAAAREPTVQIGDIEIIIEAAAAPRPSQAPAAPAPDLSSRFYLRGL